MTACNLAAQTTVSGTVTDGKETLAGANVFIIGTIDGCLTDSLGRFSFTTSTTGEVTLSASFIGFEDFKLTADAAHLTNLHIQMKERATSIDEVVVTASTFSFGKSDNFKTMDALDVVMAGNSCGDIVAALQTLPGTQMVGENGKLYVRGGESDECQTFVNGMHVLVPYSTNTENSAVRGRFSPFLFKGINFLLGGYGGEYGQALSSVLPMETTDAATSDKFSVSASLVDWNIGGTKAFHNSSLSFNAALTSMGIFNRLFSERLRVGDGTSGMRFDFSRPYRKLSGEAQFKKEFKGSGVLKSYVGYDLTSVGQRIDGRNLSLKEHNIYANATYKTSIGRGYTLFAGIANSSVVSNIDDAQTAGDHYHNFRNEIHLKAELRKVCSDVLKLLAGAEDYLRNSTLRYDDYHYQLNYNILAAYIDAQWRIIPRLFLNMSARAESLTLRGRLEGARFLLMPRATLSYIPSKQLQFSLVAGRYSQTAADDYLAMSHKTLCQSTADHATFSMQWKSQTTLLRIEPYLKKYHHLPLYTSPRGGWEGVGYGTSRGLDIFLEDHSLLKNLSTTLSYSFNDSRRLYLDYTEEQTPDYCSRHNLRLTAKYGIGKTIIGLSESYASGRHFPTGTTPHYNSVDMNLTWLVSPKVIVYTSLNNIFGRTNIFRFDANGTPVTASRDRFLYIGIFVSLKNNKAYDISNF